MRYFSGVNFFIVISLFIFPPFLGHIFKFNHVFATGLILFTLALIIALCRPYKKMYMNVRDTVLLSHLALICLMLSQKTFKYFVPVIQVFIIFPFIVLIFVASFKLICKVHRSCCFKSVHLTKYLPRCCLKAHTYTEESDSKHWEPEVSSRSLPHYGATTKK